MAGNLSSHHYATPCVAKKYSPLITHCTLPKTASPPLPPSLHRRHLGGAPGPSVGGPAEVHGGAGGPAMLLHHLQGPTQEPGPHRQLGGGGPALGGRPGEGHHQHQGPGPPGED